jgi:hypothetical protein
MQFDWGKIESAENLEQASVKLRTREPEVFKGNRQGTQLEITRLRENWSRGEVQCLHRAVNSICSPFKVPTDFDVTYRIPAGKIGSRVCLRLTTLVKRRGIRALTQTRCRRVGSSSVFEGEREAADVFPRDFARRVSD